MTTDVGMVNWGVVNDDNDAGLLVILRSTLWIPSLKVVPA